MPCRRSNRQLLQQCQQWRTFQTRGATSTAAGHQPPLGTMGFQWPLQHRVLPAPGPQALCALRGRTCPTDPTGLPSAPTSPPRCGAGPFLPSALWHKCSRPGTCVRSAATGPQRRGPHRPGWLAGLAERVPTLPMGGGSPGPPPACPTARPGCASPQAQGTSPTPSEALALQPGPHQGQGRDVTQPSSPS